MEIRQILLKYWGYSAFRPLQEEIILSVLDGRDTLALLPTGGGKSVCYQVPALAREGICLVVSPLIALMKDQVDNLRKRGIKAAALYSGMHRDEIDLVISNARFGDTKLLYLSPERLETIQMRDAINRMKVNLLAVDEAHCISQWGYDFRPPYLKIAGIRQMLPGIPVLALTATATQGVVNDIQEKLLFRQENLFRQSFERKNLTYVVVREEDKRSRLLKIIRKVPGPGIVYVRNRRGTKMLASFLEKNGVRATWYHAGLEPRVRDRVQQSWMKEEKQIIVATNAFGMGIDKPNVRTVVHMDLPDCIEAYFQEAGRGGRDQKRSWAVVLVENADIIQARQNLKTSFPELPAIRSVYQALGNHLQLPVGGGEDNTFELDLSAFCEQFNLQPVIAYHSLKLLEKEGYVMLNEGVHNPSRVFIKTSREEVYRFQVAHEAYDFFLKTLLRSYPGLFTDFVIIRETELAKRLDITPDQVVKQLQFLNQQGIIDYLPQPRKPTISYLRERVDSKDLTISPDHYRNRLEAAGRRLESLIAYVTEENRCRSQILLAYFGESTAMRCGRCDVCLKRNKLELNDQEFEEVLVRIKPILNQKHATMEELVDAATPIHEDKVIKAIRWLMDQGKVLMHPDQSLSWNQ